jgi:hypothetical protein
MPAQYHQDQQRGPCCRHGGDFSAEVPWPPFWSANAAALTTILDALDAIRCGRQEVNGGPNDIALVGAIPLTRSRVQNLRPGIAMRRLKGSWMALAI